MLIREEVIWDGIWSPKRPVMQLEDSFFVLASLHIGEEGATDKIESQGINLMSHEYAVRKLQEICRP